MTSRESRIKLGIRNCRVKMESLGLWRFVGTEDGSDLGCFHFLCNDLDGLRRRLDEVGFTRPGPTNSNWDSRERVSRASLHIKHFSGWPREKVQAHIDPYGTVGPLTWLLHLVDYNGYKDVERIARLLEVARRD